MQYILHRLLFHLGQMLIVTSTVLAGCSEASGQVSQREATRSDDTRTGKFTLMALGDNQLSDYQQLTQRHDMLIVSHMVQVDLINAFRQRNPEGIVLAYFNTSDVNFDWIKDPYHARLWRETNPHEDWFHHDDTDQRVRIYFPKYRQRFAFNTGHPKLQQYLASRVVETLKSKLYDGIQLDNVSTEFPFSENLVGSWISSVPAGLTPQQWTADETALLKTIMKAVADAGFTKKTIIFNHMRSGEPAESSAYLAIVDGANCESWMSRGTAQKGRWGWQAKVDQVRLANDSGKFTNLLCRPKVVSEREALFCFASYLIALEGDQSYFFCASAYQISAQRDWFPFYDLDLGRPVAPYQPHGEAFWRRFKKGAVAVNPSSRLVSIPLRTPYRTMSGEQIEELNLRSKEAIILLGPGQ